nr:MAG TPA: hypothetical protein [Caudoviricetes sp.]
MDKLHSLASTTLTLNYIKYNASSKILVSLYLFTFLLLLSLTEINQGYFRANTYTMVVY